MISAINLRMPCNFANLASLVNDLVHKFTKHSIVDQNTTSIAAQTDGLALPEVSFSLSNLTDIWGLVQKAQSFNFDIIGFVNENLGIVRSVSVSLFLMMWL